MRFLTALLLALTLTGCGYAPHVDPAVFHSGSDTAARESARLHAKDISGTYEHNQCCGSMEPLIVKGDWLVLKKTPYRDELRGRVGTYRPKWANGALIAHRFVSGSATKGFIASGDNNSRSEPQERVTADNYEAEVIAIYKSN